MSSVCRRGSSLPQASVPVSLIAFSLRAARVAFVFVLLLLWQSVLPHGVDTSLAEDAPDVKRLLRKFDEMFESSGTFTKMEIEIVTPRKTRTMSLRAWSKGEDKALIVIDAPARDAGMATLRVGKNLWNYLPKISRTIRVPPSMMMGSWMGSDFTNDDLVRESSYEEDYTSRLEGPSTDPPGWKVRLDARPDVVGLWNRVEVVFSRDTEVPVQVQYFDRKDRLSRTMHLSEVKRFGRRLVPTVMTVVPEREEGRLTRLRYEHLEFDLDLDESMFSLSQLERKH
jgi:outer membrane lipoprotein-sorting protein